MQANKHEIEQALAEGIHIRGSLARSAIVRGRERAGDCARVVQCEAEYCRRQAGDQEHRGTEQDIRGRPDRFGDRPGSRFHRAGAIQQRQGAVSTDRNYLVAGQPQGVFAGGDVIRPTSADHRDRTRPRLRRGHPQLSCWGSAWRSSQDRRASSSTWMRQLVEKGIKSSARRNRCAALTAPMLRVHNFDRTASDHVTCIPHDKLFLGHFSYVPRQASRGDYARQGKRAGQTSMSAWAYWSEALAIAEAKRCMSCGMCFECDNCVVYCPQTAVYRVKKTEATTGRYVATNYDKCIGCHICADVCPTGYIQMG